MPDEKHEPLNSPPHQEFVHDPSNNNNEEEQQHQNERQRLVKPKSLKVLSEYEKCKSRCKQERDQESASQVNAQFEIDHIFLF